MRILVRSKRDADAVKAVLERFAETGHWSVESLGGLRGEKLAGEVRSRIEPFTMVLLGREDASIHTLVKPLEEETPFTAVLLARTKRLRNSTLEMIHSLLTRGRAIIRMKTKWGKSYILSGYPKGRVIDLPVEPYYDTFFLYSKGAERILEVLGLAGDPGLLFVVKGPRGLHYIFSGDKLVGKVNFSAPNLGAGPASGSGGGLAKTSVRELVEENTEILDILEDHAVRAVRRAFDQVKPRRVIVPLSGGKDSAAALLLASKALGKDRVTAVYVDTGIDFPQNREAAEKIASITGVDLVEVRAGVDRGLIEEGLPLPDPRNRWCTGRKLDALRRTVRALEPGGRILIVVGDRDSESEKRSRRPLLRRDAALPYPAVSPIRLWSGAHVMAYLWRHGALVNELYRLGFYRTGCYLCFSLRSWELRIMAEEGIISSIVRSRPSHKALFERFLSVKPGAPFGERRGEDKTGNAQHY